MSPEKAKFLLKKYLSFEKDHGDAAGVEAVKQRAAQWVAQHTKQNSDEEDTDA